MTRLLALLLLLSPLPGWAQTQPTPDPANPRLQTIEWAQGEEVLLSILPDTGLTVMLEMDERIERVTVSDASLLDIRVSPDGNSFIVLPLADIRSSTITVQTDRRNYPFAVRTSDSLLSAVLLQFEYGLDDEEAAFATSQPENGPLWSYRFRGDREVRPEIIRDDARRTFIHYAPGQPLPAVFAIAPTGDEEVVNGHMRDGVYVIDRVYSELVFRIDDERATARRNNEPDGDG